MMRVMGSRTSRTGGRSSCLLLAVIAFLTLPVVARAATDYPLPAHQKGVNNAVKTVPATPERIAALRVPPGFALNVFARDLVNPRMMASRPTAPCT